MVPKQNLHRNRHLRLLKLLLFVPAALLFMGVTPMLNEGTDGPSNHAYTILVGGVSRTYLLHVPPEGVQTQPMPLVIVLHGGGGTGESMIRLTRGEFNTLADKEGFVVVYPDGVTSNRPIKRHWNDGRDRRFSQSDDIGFISALIDYLAQTLNIDRRRVYATGISNGAQMCMRLARELSDKIAAFAPVAYAMPEKFTSLPISARPISVLIITGTTDPLLPWKGGETRDPGRTRRLGKILSVRASARAFAKFDSCSLTPEVSFESPKNTPDGTKVLKEVYRQGKDGSTVILYAIENGGHGWPGGLQYLPEAFVGKTSKQIDACEVIWEFFKANGQ